MSKPRSKPFQSGREVMEAFVPEYVPRPVIATSRRRNSIAGPSVEAVTADILEAFSEKMQAIDVGGVTSET